MSPAGKSFLVTALIIVVAIAVVLAGVLYNVNKTRDTNEETEETRALTEHIREASHRIADCTTVGGKCYEDNLKRSGEAVQAIIEGQQAQIVPHRLRNEAESLCTIIALAGSAPIIAGSVDTVVQYYNQCVLERSGGTEAPPLPINPYATTTTTTGRTR